MSVLVFWSAVVFACLVGLALILTANWMNRVVHMSNLIHEVRVAFLTEALAAAEKEIARLRVFEQTHPETRLRRMEAELDAPELDARGGRVEGNPA